MLTFLIIKVLFFNFISKFKNTLTASNCKGYMTILQTGCRRYQLYEANCVFCELYSLGFLNKDALFVLHLFFRFFLSFSLSLILFKRLLSGFQRSAHTKSWAYPVHKLHNKRAFQLIKWSISIIIQTVLVLQEAWWVKQWTWTRCVWNWPSTPPPRHLPPFHHLEVTRRIKRRKRIGRRVDQEIVAPSWLE